MLKWLKNRRDKKRRKAAAKKVYADDVRIISRAEHGISRKNIDESALKVLYRLNKAGFEAYLVGGAVRDLLLGKRPKDFDVATDATPEQVKDLFNDEHVQFLDEALEKKVDALVPGTILFGKIVAHFGNDVIVGSNAVILGAITIGDNTRIGSGAVVIKPVPADSTAVGVPARVVRGPHVEKETRVDLRHDRLTDPVAEVYRDLDERLREVQAQVASLTRAIRSAEPGCLAAQ